MRPRGTKDLGPFTLISFLHYNIRDMLLQDDVSLPPDQRSSSPRLTLRSFSGSAQSMTSWKTLSSTIKRFLCCSQHPRKCLPTHFVSSMTEASVCTAEPENPLSTSSYQSDSLHFPIRDFACAIPVASVPPYTKIKWNRNRKWSQVKNARRRSFFARFLSVWSLRLLSKFSWKRNSPSPFWRSIINYYTPVNYDYVAVIFFGRSPHPIINALELHRDRVQWTSSHADLSLLKRL